MDKETKARFRKPTLCLVQHGSPIVISFQPSAGSAPLSG
jgi:hypothetical protein